MRRIAIHPAAFLLAIGLVVSFACDSDAPSKSDTSQSNTSKARADGGRGRFAPLCEYSGTIDHLVIHQPEKLVGQAWRATHDLLAALPNTTITLVCNSDAAVSEVTGRLRQWKFTDRGNVRLLPVEGPLLVWARDRYIAMCPESAGGLPVWLTPRPPASFDAERRGAERGIPDVFNEIEPTCRRVDTPLVLEGGNVVASEANVYIGTNVLRENAAQGDAARVREMLQSLFAGRLVIVGDAAGNTPTPHVDMYLTVIGDNKVVVGSPALAKKSVASATDDSAKALYERLYVTPNMPPPVGPDFTAARVKLLDDIAARLAAEGVEVARIPYADSRGGDFIVTYNNVLQERRDGKHVVIMPTYDIPALDRAARETYESLGMTVREVNVSTICHLLGAVRCMGNVVGRK